MACLSDEQLVEVALAMSPAEQLSAHIEGCDACRARLAGIQEVTAELAAAHAELDRGHAASRARLLASVANVEIAQPGTAWNRLSARLRSLTIGQRVAAGGLSVSTIAVLLLILLALVNSAGRLSAMERMLKAVRSVNSYSFRFSNTTTFPPKEGKTPEVRKREDITRWRAPAAADAKWLGDLSAETKAWRENGDDPARGRGGKRSLFVQEIYPTGKPGILIVYTSKFGGRYFWYTPPLAADEIPNYSPIAKLRTVREQSGKVVRELGTKEIGGKQARGYIATFEDAPPLSDCGEVEVWVDAATDLPVEFSWKQEQEGIVDEFHLFDCQWNIDLDAQLFSTTPPAGFTDATPPTKESDFAQIVAALKLYAQLGGGHYPRGTEFDGAAIHEEMLQLAGFSGAPRDEWQRDAKYVEIQQAEVGLDWVARVLVDKINSGYYGESVGPQDADKVLLWWWSRQNGAGADRRFRVFYGDLRTELLPFDEWSKLVSEETAAPFLPE